MLSLTARRRFLCLSLAVTLAAYLGGSALALEKEGRDYEIGGPLAGERLPLFPGQHGEPVGHPGSIPGQFDTEGLAPEWDLYSGSVEHWRAYWFKYCPVRSFFDRQSQLKNWVAPKIPGATGAQVEQYASPVYWVPRHAPMQNTGATLAPVPVIRVSVDTPVFSLDLGELPIGLYAVRVIAAVPTADLQTYLKPAYLRFSVNDGLGGEPTPYKKRIGYCDEFYSVCEFYFHAPEKRRYEAKLWMDAGSAVDLLVHNISLDDVLAGATRAAIKKGTYQHVVPETRTESKYDSTARLARDAYLWQQMPPVNHEGSGGSFTFAASTCVFPPEIRMGTLEKTSKEIAEAHGKWGNSPTPGVFLTNKKLKLDYTIEDMLAYRPLPDPYPFKDDGTGLFFPDPEKPGTGAALTPIAMAVTRRIMNIERALQKPSPQWLAKGDVDAAHDQALKLVRYAYRLPSIEVGNFHGDLCRSPGAYGRYMSNRRRQTGAFYSSHYQTYPAPVKTYDALFDYISTSQLLADSVGRYIPWVKTPTDVVKLLDVYLVQNTAKRILRYHYYTVSMGIADCASVLGASPVSAPWMEWLFNRTFVYPLPPTGIQDSMITATDRSGTKYVGSAFYCLGASASEAATALQSFKDAGLLPSQYDLTDSTQYPKPLATCYWSMRAVLGGLEIPRIGDVRGPEKAPGSRLGTIAPLAVSGWKWSKDPAFAWAIVDGKQLETFSPKERAEIETAAATVKRAPWLENRSRMLYNWFGALENGVSQDDVARRSSAYVRIGAGWGHHHDDSLDLQFIALGLPMTVDGGQRPTYSSPADRSPFVHNVVAVDGRSGRTASWVRTLSDAEGARFMSIDTPPEGSTTFYRRDVALLSVGSDSGQSYIFDVFRVSGGKRHRHCFHGPVSDEVTCNAPLQAVPEAGAEADMAALNAFIISRDAWRAADAPLTLETTWRYSREKTHGNERSMLLKRYDEAAPRKFTRLTLLDAAGLRVRHADHVCTKLGYRLNCQLVDKQSDVDMESAFAAIVEPYEGTPFLTKKQLLTVAENETDARRAVAVAVETTSGQHDICFTDGRREKTRSVGDLTVAGEFAYVSRDAKGLRCAALTGGTLLQGKDFSLKVAQCDYQGQITAIDYLAKKVTLDTPWPADCGGGVMLIETAGRTTAANTLTVTPTDHGSIVTMQNGSDYLRSGIVSIDETVGQVTLSVNPTLANVAGLTRGFVASNEDRTRFWRADFVNEKTIQLRDGEPVTKTAFAPNNIVRLWEYGVGDTVRMATSASVRRQADGTYKVSGNADVEAVTGKTKHRLVGGQAR